MPKKSPPASEHLPNSSQQMVSTTQLEQYVEPVADPYDKGTSYLEKHSVLQLFQNLTSEVIYNQPLDPLDQLIKEVQHIKQLRDKNISSKGQH